MGYPSALSAKFWGYEDVKMKGQKLTIPQEFGSYVMENVLFKISFPAEFHAQTAVEAALALHDEVKNRLDEVEKIVITTQESGHRSYRSFHTKTVRDRLADQTRFLHSHS